LFQLTAVPLGALIVVPTASAVIYCSLFFQSPVGVMEEFEATVAVLNRLSKAV